MRYDQFLDALGKKKYANFIYEFKQKDVNFYYRDPCPYALVEKRLISPDDMIIRSWKSGGKDGGSWRDDDELYDVTPEDKPSFESLQVILNDFCPNLKYNEFLEIEKIIKEDSYTINEYYGNYSEYTFEYIALSDLHKKLVELGVF